MARLVVVGLGPGDPEMLPEAARKALQGAARVFLRTRQHPLVPDLQRQGIPFVSLDWVYETAPTFEAVYDRIAQEVLTAALAEGPDRYVAFAVPGHPMVAEAAVREILARGPAAGIEIRVVAAPSCLDALFGILRLDPAEGLQVLDALEIGKQSPVPSLHAVILQVYDRYVAASVKLELMRTYPDDHPVVVVHAAGVAGVERVLHVPLYELDRLDRFDHLTTVCVPPAERLAVAERLFADLVRVVERLRAPGGCPWDRQQTHRSLRPYVLEEAYEVVEAIDGGRPEALAEELGDLLLQVILHSVIGAEEGAFDIRQVLTGVTEKIVRRHPHVFADGRAETPEQVAANWEDIKRREKGKVSDGDASVLAGVPGGLPSLVEAEELQARAARVGFDWPSAGEAWLKVEEELRELRDAISSGGEAVEEEWGDLLFALVNVARLAGIHAEIAAKAANRKFSRRFRRMEDLMQGLGKDWQGMTLEEMDRLWQAVKADERAKKL